MGTMWLNLEAGTARAIGRESGVTFDVPPSGLADGMGWRPLIIVAAHTCFPEASIDDLPMWAAAEVARGLDGPLRHRIATTRPDDPQLPTLRDDLMVALGATPDAGGAVRLVDRLYADRLLRHQVPPVITAGCLAWYGHWRDSSVTIGAEITKAATRYADDWITHADQRPTIDAEIVELAEGIAGHPHLVPLEDRAV
jgi:hypothetical protein